MFRTLARQLRDRLNKSSRPKRRPRPGRDERARPRLEALEDRCVPTVLFSPVLAPDQLVPTPNHDFHYQTLSSPSVYLIFWGTYWQGHSQEVNAVRADAQTIMAGPYTNGLTRYGSDGRAVYATTYVDTSSSPPAGYDPGNGNARDVNGNTSLFDLQTEVARAITNRSVSGVLPPPPNGDAIYVVVAPSSNGNRSYNDHSGSYAGAPLSVISLAFDGNRDDTSAVFGHELIEAMSDPNAFGVHVVTANGSTDQICDVEPGEYWYRLGGPGGVLVPSYWHNAISSTGAFILGAGDCIVPDGNAQQLTLQAAPGSWTHDSQGWHFNRHGPFHLTIQGDQPGAYYNDHTVALTATPAGLEVVLNGERFLFAAGTIDGISVDLGNPNWGGTSTMTVDDTVDATAHNVTVGPNEIHGLPWGTISYTHVARVNVSLAGGRDSVVDVQGGGLGTTWTVRDDAHGGVSFENGNLRETIDVRGLDFPDHLQLVGLGSDTVNVQGLPLVGTLVAINLGGGTNVVNVTPFDHTSLTGDQAQTLDFIRGNLFVNGGAGTDTLVLDDLANTNPSAWTVTHDTVSRTYRPEIGGLLGPPVNRYVYYRGITNLVIDTGHGRNTITLSPTAQDLDELPHSVTTLLGSSEGSVTIHGGGSDTLILDDQHSTYASTWTATGSTVTRSYHLGGFFPETVTSSVNYSGVADLVLNAGSGGNTITLSPMAHNLDELPHTVGDPLFAREGSVTIHGGGTDTLILNDQSNAQASTWTATGSAVVRSYRTGTLLVLTVTSTINYNGVANLQVNGGSGGNTYALNNPGPFNLTLNTGSGNNHVNVLAVAGTPGGTFVNIDGNGGNDVVMIGSLAPALGGTLANIYGSIAVLNPTGHTDLLVDDSGDPLPATVGLSHTTGGNFMSHTTSHANIGFGGDGHVFVTYDGGPRGGSVIDFGTPGTPATLNLQGPETVSVLTTGAPLTIDGGGGQDTVNLGNSTNGVAGIQGAVSITNNPAAGGYTALTVDDSADSQGYWLSTLTASAPGSVTPDASLTTDPNSQVRVAPINFLQSGLSSLRVLLGNSPSGVSANIVTVVNTPTSGVSGGLMTTITTGTPTGGAPNSDAVFVRGTTGPLTVNLKGGYGQQVVVVGSTSHTLNSIHGAVSVNGLSGAADSNLYVDDGGAMAGQHYVITNHTVSRPGVPVITYNIVNELVVYAGSGVNTIDVQSTSPATVVNAGPSGHDTINVGDAGPHGTLADISNNYLAININNPGNRVSLHDKGSSRSLRYTFTNFEGVLPTLFRYDAQTQQQLTHIFFNGPLQKLALHGSNGADTFTVDALLPNVSQLKIKGGSGSNTLRGPDRDNTWQITGPNAGSLDGVVQFASVQDLVGGSANDTFQFHNGGSLAGTLDGGGGSNTLDYSPYVGDITVDLALNLASLVHQGAANSVFNIQNVIGSQGNDLLVGDPGPNVLIGGTGRNILIGGPGADTLDASRSTDDNILIGGGTSYDQDLAALDLLMQEWLQPSDFATRQDAIRRGLDLLAGTGIRLDDTTLQPDGEANVLVPGPGNNWLIP
jgi:hypothetical protein